MVLTHKGSGRTLNVAAAPPWESWQAADGGGISWSGELRMQVETAPKLNLEVHAICSAYAGADVVAGMALDVRNFRVERDDDDSDDEDEPEDHGENESGDFEDDESDDEEE